MNVKFLDYASREVVAAWFGVDHWVPREEQVWSQGQRYSVVRVEHLSEDEVHCFVREIN